MTDELRAALREYLTENLTVDVNLSTERDYGEGDGRYAKLTVTLKLEGEVISESRSDASVGEF